MSVLNSCEMCGLNGWEMLEDCACWLCLGDAFI